MPLATLQVSHGKVLNGLTIERLRTKKGHKVETKREGGHPSTCVRINGFNSVVRRQWELETRRKMIKLERCPRIDKALECLCNNSYIALVKWPTYLKSKHRSSKPIGLGCGGQSLDTIRVIVLIDRCRACATVVYVHRYIMYTRPRCATSGPPAARQAMSHSPSPMLL